MPDESMMAPCSVWAQVRVTSVPIDRSRKPEAVEVGIKVCSVPDPEDAVRSWSIELHTEGAVPASSGAGQDFSQNRAQAAPKEAFYAEAAFQSSAALTHIKGRCETRKGERFTRAVKLPEALVFMPGDRARIEINVYMDSAAQIPQPSVEVFQEPEPGQAAAPPALGSSRYGLSGGMPTRPIGLFY